MDDKSQLSEADIQTKYIEPALTRAGWDLKSPLVRKEFKITNGRIIAKAQVCKRDKPLRADYVLFSQPNQPIAVIEAKDNKHSVGHGIQQALKYAGMLDVPFAFSSNGDGFLFHNALATDTEPIEQELSLDEFPSPEQLLEMYDRRCGLTDDQKRVAAVPFYTENPNKSPRYYQCVAVNRVVNAIAGGEKRALLVMATGTGKTYTAFQIIWHLWKAGIKKRILFLVDRRSLASQTVNNDFAPFGDKMMWVTKNNLDTAHEIYVGLYQGLTNEDSDADSDDAAALFKNFSSTFFDLVIVDECHRGSIKENSRWRTVLEYFKDAAQIGMTATPKETSTLSTIEYFGEPIYEYSLKQGIDDGFLAPYRVIRVIFDKDADGFTPYEGQLDDNGEIIESRTFNTSDFDRRLILKKRTALVAKTVSDYLKKHNCRMDKSIFFCVDQDHAERMRQALVAENPDLVKEDSRYAMRITANDEFGVKELDNFQNPESKFPVLVTTSKLLSTGVDVKTCKFIVLDSNIRSMIEFKQIIGRGTRVMEEADKLYFTIFDFRGVTRLFHDPDFDGPIEQDDEFHPDDGGDEPPPPPTVPPKPRKPKFVLGGEPVQAIARTIHYRNAEGKVVVENVEVFTRRCVQGKFESLQSFLAIWRGADRKNAVIGELEREGVSFADLAEQLDTDIDPFDLICHIVYNRPPLTRAERARNVRKRDIFGKYGETAAKVLDAILEKYASRGIGEIETDEDNILRTNPISSFGTPVFIVNRVFGGIRKFRAALHELEDAIYADVQEG